MAEAKQPHRGAAASFVECLVCMECFHVEGECVPLLLPMRQACCATLVADGLSVTRFVTTLFVMRLTTNVVPR